MAHLVAPATAGGVDVVADQGLVAMDIRQLQPRDGAIVFFEQAIEPTAAEIGLLIPRDEVMEIEVAALGMWIRSAGGEPVRVVVAP